MWTADTLGPVSFFAEKTVRPKTLHREALAQRAGSACPLSRLPASPTVPWGSQCVGRSPGLGVPFPQAPGPACLPGGRGTGALFSWLGSQIHYSDLP